MVPNFLGEVSEVCVGWDKFLASVVLPVPGLAHNQDVVAASEWVSVVRNWFKNDLTLVSDSLVSAAAVIVPLWDVSKGLDWTIKSSCLGSECDSRAIDPDVFSNDLSMLVDAKEVFGVLVVEVVSVRYHAF